MAVDQRSFSKRPPHSKDRPLDRKGAQRDSGREKLGKPKPADGLVARDIAVSALFSVLSEKRAFDDAFAKAAETRNIAPRDRAFARLIATTVLRRHGELKAVLAKFLEKPLPERQGRLIEILLSAAAQLLILKTPPHAAISLAVDQCYGDQPAQRFAKLVNAVLRKVSEHGHAVLASLDGPRLNIPNWLFARWQTTYGEPLARQIAGASLREAPLDLTVKSDCEAWAAKIGGVVLSTGSLRIVAAGRVEDLPGYDEGAWWVQDAAAALPAKLLGAIAGQRVADLCAAPGGKTAQLALSGAHVTAVDKSRGRLLRLSENLARLGLKAGTAVADAAEFAAENMFDAILIDAPCTATGTIRRHPDILHLKRPQDVAALAGLQGRILQHAAGLLAPGGTLVYCICSLEPEEGIEQVTRFLSRYPEFSRRAVLPSEIGCEASWITADGDLQTLPHFFDDRPEGQKGIDGFYAARLVRRKTL